MKHASSLGRTSICPRPPADLILEPFEHGVGGVRGRDCLTVAGMRRCEVEMAVTVVLDHPRQHLLRRAWRQLGAFWGGTLLVVGLLASLVALPTTLAVATFVLGRFDEPAAGEEPWPTPEVPVEEIVLAWGISTPIAIVGLMMGPRLLRGERKLVLFLRRFGYADATRAVTFAAAKTVGGSWRLVTLDDKEIAPLGIPAGTRWLYGAGAARS